MLRRLTPILLVAALFVCADALAQQKKGAPSPDDGKKVFKLQPKAHAKFTGGKVASTQGSTSEKGHYYLLANLATTQPVTVTLVATNKGDDIRLAVSKKDWKDVKRDASTAGKGVGIVKFRTHGDARIQVSAKGATAKPYRLLVAVGDDVKPTAKPAFMPADEYRRKHPK